MKTFFGWIGVCLLLTSYTFKASSPVDVNWVDKLDGDFSFAKKRSISSEAWCYEWGGTDKISVIQQGKNSVYCYTAMNAATHCSLYIVLANNSCIPTIRLRSIVHSGTKIYEVESGTISIDKKLWDKKILKAVFDFNFKKEAADPEIFWKGRIYATMQ